MKKLKAVISDRLASYTPGFGGGKMWLVVGLACLIVDMAIGYSAGRAQATVWHGIGGAALALGFAFLPDAAYEEFKHRRALSGLIVAALCIPIGLKAYEQQLTYTAGMRGNEITGVHVVNARKSNAQANVKHDEKLLSELEKQLEALTAQNGWATSIKAEALREQVANADEYIKKEAERGGCKAKCEARMREKDALVTKIGVVEQAEDLSKRIAALHKALEGARAEDDKREVATSLNVSVAETTAAMINLVWGASPEDALKTTDVSMRYATIGSAGLGSLALLVLAPVGFFLAGRRRYEHMIEEPPVAPSNTYQPPRLVPKNTATETHNHVNVVDVFAKYQAALHAEKAARGHA